MRWHGPEKVRGFGHVKIANLRSAKRQEAELLRQLGVLPEGGIPAPVLMAVGWLQRLRGMRAKGRSA